MAYPPIPITVQILDRIMEVVKDIGTAGDFFYPIGENVGRGLRHFAEATSFPYLTVFMGSDHRPPEYLPDHRVYRYAKFIVAGVTDEENGEPVTKMLKVLADVQKALEADLKSQAAGSLGTLVGWGHLGSVYTDEGELGLEGNAGFRQDIDTCLIGDWGDF